MMTVLEKLNVNDVVNFDRLETFVHLAQFYVERDAQLQAPFTAKMLFDFVKNNKIAMYVDLATDTVNAGWDVPMVEGVEHIDEERYIVPSSVVGEIFDAVVEDFNLQDDVKSMDIGDFARVLYEAHNKRAI